MSADPVGGYILFPSTLAYTDLIATTLKAMELAPDERAVRLPGDDGPFLPEEGYPFSTDEPPEQALALLAQKKRGVIKGEGAKHPETYWFEPAVEGYPVVTIWYEAWNMYYDKWPDDIDSFARRWLQFCEQGQAFFKSSCQAPAQSIEYSGQTTLSLLVGRNVRIERRRVPDGRNVTC